VAITHPLLYAAASALLLDSIEVLLERQRQELKAQSNLSDSLNSSANTTEISIARERRMLAAHDAFCKWNEVRLSEEIWLCI
jgi:hypothetical protein